MRKMLITLALAAVPVLAAAQTPSQTPDSAKAKPKTSHHAAKPKPKAAADTSKAKPATPATTTDTTKKPN